ncbi:MAG: ABC transporter permease [Defluviitaleaceae bacterium]|nr:ABC transporter permease [Defluviitaleaceae bacterium]
MDIETPNVGDVKIISLRKIFIREIFADKLALVSLFVFVGIMLFVFIGAAVIGVDQALAFDIFNLNQAPTWWPFGNGGSPTGGFLGTTPSGQSMAQILIVAARNSIIIGFSVSFLSLTTSILLGLVIGYYGGHIDNVAMRIMDTLVIIPTIMVMIIVRTLMLDFGVFHMVMILYMFSWIGPARGIRNLTMGQKVQDYVAASKTLGTRNIAIIFKKILPNLTAMISAMVVLTVGTSIGIETGLAVIGFGLPVGTPSLGNLVANALNPTHMSQRQWNWLPAVILILIIIISINFVGQAMSRAANAQQRLSS